MPASTAAWPVFEQRSGRNSSPSISQWKSSRAYPRWTVTGCSSRIWTSCGRPLPESGPFRGADRHDQRRHPSMLPTHQPRPDTFRRRPSRRASPSTAPLPSTVPREAGRSSPAGWYAWQRSRSSRRSPPARPPSGPRPSWPRRGQSAPASRRLAAWQRPCSSHAAAPAVPSPCRELAAAAMCWPAWKMSSGVMAPTRDGWREVKMGLSRPGRARRPRSPTGPIASCRRPVGRGRPTRRRPTARRSPPRGRRGPRALGVDPGRAR